MPKAGVKKLQVAEHRWREESARRLVEVTVE
jgi:hypothetical protein